MATVHSEINEAGRSWIVDKIPKNITGLTAALISTPYGHRSIVTDSIEFTFSKGLLVERPYIFNKTHSFKEINYYPPEFLRKYVGTQWDIINNCFVFFNKF
jgi:hypothetical protein